MTPPGHRVSNAMAGRRRLLHAAARRCRCARRCVSAVLHPV